MRGFLKRKIVYVVIMLSVFIVCACVSEKEEVPEMVTETQEPYITSICTVPKKVEITDPDVINEIVELFKSKEYVERKPLEKGYLGMFQLDFVYSDGSCVHIVMVEDYLATEDKAYNIVDTELITELKEYFYPEIEE